MFSCEFCKISKNTFFHKTPLVAVSVSPRCYVANQFFGIAYFTDILSFEKFSQNLHWNLKLIFLFSTLFIHFKIGYRQSFMTILRIFFFFLIYELNAVVSIHSNAFYPSTSTSKMLYVNFCGARFVTICLLCKSFIHCFPQKLFDFWWLSFITVRCFFIHWYNKNWHEKNAKISELERLELKIFFAPQPWWAASS